MSAPKHYSLSAEPGSFQLKGAPVTFIIHGREITSGDTVTRVKAPGSESVARINPAGQVAVTVTGAEGIGRAGETRVAQVICARLAQEGIQGQVLPGSDQRGEDRLLRAAGGHLNLQIVTVPSAPDFWQAARHASASTEVSLEGAVDWIHESIQKKVAKTAEEDRGTMVLALDAHHASTLAEPAVIEAYLGMHGDPASAYGFAGVWVVGATASQCARIGRSAL